MNAIDIAPWIGDWAWSLPLIVLTVVIHVCGLALIGGKFVAVLGESSDARNFIPKFALVIDSTALLATVLHGIESAIWAAAYRVLGALPDNRFAMLYSLSAMTTYGHSNRYLKDQWQLMGALEALNGMLLFGLTTAFLFAMIQRVWPLGSREQHREPQLRNSRHRKFVWSMLLLLNHKHEKTAFVFPVWEVGVFGPFPRRIRKVYRRQTFTLLPLSFQSVQPVLTGNT